MVVKVLPSPSAGGNGRLQVISVASFCRHAVPSSDFDRFRRVVARDDWPLSGATTGEAPSATFRTASGSPGELGLKEIFLAAPAVRTPCVGEDSSEAAISARIEECDGRALAFHEAGHAVVAILLGIPVCSVSIVSEGDSYGRVSLGVYPPWAALVEGAPVDDSGRRAVRAQVLVSFSGPSAEEQLTGTACESADNDGYEQAEMLELLGGSGSERLDELLSLNDLSEQLVRWYWPAIEAVAQELIDRRQLSGRRARKIVHRALSSGSRSSPQRGAALRGLEQAGQQ